MGQQVPNGLEGIHSPVAARVAGITIRQIDHWARTRVVVPSIAEARGYGTARLYNFRDLVSLRVVRDLLRARLSLQRVRRAVVALREWDETLASCRLLTDGKEVLLVYDEQKAIALLTKPGQLTWRATLDVAAIATETRAALRAERVSQDAPQRAAGGRR